LNISTQLYIWQFSIRRRLAVLRCRSLKRKTVRDRPRLESNRILLVATGLLGDTVMCTPVMAEARRLFPKARIVGLVNSRNRDLLEPSGWFDDFLVCDSSPFPWRPRNINVVRLLMHSIQMEHFDLAIVLLGDDWAPLLYRAGIPRRAGPSDGYFAALLTDLYPIGAPNAWGPNDRLNALRCLGLEINSPRPRIIVSQSARFSIQERLKWNSISGDKPLIVFHPFAAASSRTLPPERIGYISQRLTEILDARVVIIGAVKRQQLVRHGLMPNRDGVYDYVSQLSIQETCALIERAHIVLTTDSGPLHLAGALGRPTVGLFRAIRPEYANLYPTVVPVFWDGGRECLAHCTWDSWYGCQVSPCRQLVGISVDRILDAVSCQLRTQKNFSSAMTDR